MPNATGKEVISELDIERLSPPCPGTKGQRPKVRSMLECLVGVAGSAGGCTEGSVVGQDEMNGKDRRDQLVPNFCASLRNLDLTLGAMGGNA